MRRITCLNQKIQSEDQELTEKDTDEYQITSASMNYLEELENND